MSGTEFRPKKRPSGKAQRGGFASDQSAYVTGIALTVDGGWLAEKSFAAGEAAASTFLAPNETAGDA